MLRDAFEKTPAIVDALHNALASSFERVLGTLSKLSTENDIRLYS